MTIWAIGSSTLLALLALVLRSPYVAILSIPFAWVAYVSAARQAVRTTGDWLCPPVVFTVVSAIRFAVPLVLIAGGTDRDVPMFRLMGLTWEDWLFGYALTNLAMLGFLLPWSFQRRLPRLPRLSRDLFRLPGTLDSAAVAAAGIGLVALVLFVGSSVQLGDAIVTGAFRTAKVQEGTGVYFFVSLLLFAGTSVLSCRFLFDRGFHPLTACAPAVVASAAFWILGGRVRAAIPLAVALMLVTYRRNADGRRRQTTAVGTVMRVVGVVLFTAWLFGAGDLYRGGATTIEGAPLAALQRVGDLSRWRYTMVTDFGQLHSAAATTRLDPGEIGGKTYTANILWPMSEVLNIEGRSVGTHIVQRTYRLRIGDWGFHSGAATDAYLNFGLWAVPALAAAFGWAMRQLYWRFRRGQIVGVLYVLGFVYAVRLFYEGIEQWPETVVVLGFLWLVIRIRRPGMAPVSPTSDAMAASSR